MHSFGVLTVRSGSHLLRSPSHKLLDVCDSEESLEAFAGATLRCLLGWLCIISIPKLKCFLIQNPILCPDGKLSHKRWATGRGKYPLRMMLKGTRVFNPKWSCGYAYL